MSTVPCYGVTVQHKAPVLDVGVVDVHLRGQTRGAERGRGWALPG